MCRQMFGVWMQFFSLSAFTKQFLWAMLWLSAAASQIARDQIPCINYSFALQATSSFPSSPRKRAVYLYTHKKRNSRTPFTIQEKRSLRERERPHVHHQANLLHLYFYYKCSFPCFDFFNFILFYLYFLIIFLFLFAVLCCLIGYGLHLISYTKIRQNTTFRKTPFSPIHSPNFLKNALNK